jgi:glutamine cyclotransferase
VRFHPSTGEVVGWLDLDGMEEALEYRSWDKGDVLNGIAQDPHDGMIWVTGKNWRHFYKIIPSHSSYLSHIPLL